MRGDEAAVFLTLAFLMVIAGVFVIVTGLRHRLKIIEMAHRERLAMIERGVAPPSDRGAAAFFQAIGSRSHRPAQSDRRLSFGIGMIGWGAGIAALFSLAFGVPGVGLGFGGAFAAVGAAMIVAALVTRDDHASASTPAPPPVFPAAPPPADAPPLDPDRP